MEDQVTIIVTQEDIDNGQRMSASKCPIALAASRLLGKRVSVINRISVWHSYDDNSRVASYIIPTDVLKDFLNAFDNGKPVSPITFVAENAMCVNG